MTMTLEMRAEQCMLCGLARPVETFDYDKGTAHRGRREHPWLKREESIGQLDKGSDVELDLSSRIYE